MSRRDRKRKPSRQNSYRSQNRNYYYSDAYTDDEPRHGVRDGSMTDKEAWVEDYVYGRSRRNARRPQSAVVKTNRGRRPPSPNLIEVGRYEKDGKIYCDYRLAEDNYSEPIVIKRTVPAPPPKPTVRHVGVQMTTNYTTPPQRKIPTRDAFTQTRVATRSAYTQIRPRPKPPVKPKELSPIVIIPPPSPPRTPSPPPPKIEEPQYIYVPKSRPKAVVVRTEQIGRPGYMVSDRNSLRHYPLRVIEYDHQQSNRALKDMYIRTVSSVGRSRRTFVPLGYEMYMERPYRIPDCPR